jgi:hypothetical protein
MNKNNKIIILPDEVIISKILFIRGQKVMIDRDLAELYEVETKVLKQAVRRNLDIFPEHFMFELTEDEFNNLRSQTVTSSWGGQRYLPFVFTEHGILQLANVIKSIQARKISIRIIEVFIKMREMLLSHKELFAELEQIKKQLSFHDDQFMLIFEYIKQFEEAKQQHLEQTNRKKIGYKSSEK